MGLEGEYRGYRGGLDCGMARHGRVQRGYGLKIGGCGADLRSLAYWAGMRAEMVVGRSQQKAHRGAFPRGHQVRPIVVNPLGAHAEPFRGFFPRISGGRGFARRSLSWWVWSSGVGRGSSRKVKNLESSQLDRKSTR